MPRWQLATVLILAGALAIAISSERWIEAAIIGPLMIPSLFVIGVWVVERRRRSA